MELKEGDWNQIDEQTRIFIELNHDRFCNVAVERAVLGPTQAGVHRLKTEDIFKLLCDGLRYQAIKNAEKLYEGADEPAED